MRPRTPRKNLISRCQIIAKAMLRPLAAPAGFCLHNTEPLRLGPPVWVSSAVFGIESIVRVTDFKMDFIDGKAQRRP